jgi:hypothetical protein
MAKIMIDHQAEAQEPAGQDAKKEFHAKPNLFQGRTEAAAGNARFPDWDVVPPNQFINPRIKKQ